MRHKKWILFLLFLNQRKHMPKVIEGKKDTNLTIFCFGKWKTMELLQYQKIQKTFHRIVNHINVVDTLIHNSVNFNTFSRCHKSWKPFKNTILISWFHNTRKWYTTFSHSFIFHTHHNDIKKSVCIEKNFTAMKNHVFIYKTKNDKNNTMKKIIISLWWKCVLKLLYPTDNAWISSFCLVICRFVLCHLLKNCYDINN